MSQPNDTPLTDAERAECSNLARQLDEQSRTSEGAWTRLGGPEVRLIVNALRRIAITRRVSEEEVRKVMASHPWEQFSGGSASGLKAWRCACGASGQGGTEDHVADMLASAILTVPAPDLVEERAFVIWSYRHDEWWRPDRHGYTSTLQQAGRYTLAEAADIVISDALPGDEVAMHETVAERFKPATQAAVPAHDRELDDLHTLCTGLAAVWCPIHGNCTCRDEDRAEDEGRELDRSDCPLHGRQSDHAERIVVVKAPTQPALDRERLAKALWMTWMKRHFDTPYGTWDDESLSVKESCLAEADRVLAALGGAP